MGVIYLVSTLNSVATTWESCNKPRPARMPGRPSPSSWTSSPPSIAGSQQFADEQSLHSAEQQQPAGSSCLLAERRRRPHRATGGGTQRQPVGEWQQEQRASRPRLRHRRIERQRFRNWGATVGSDGPLTFVGLK
jgi:hypothetical protein